MLPEQPLKEKELMLQVAEGNHVAFETIFEQYQRKVYTYAITILRDETAAEEIVQEVFMNIWMKREQLASVNNFAAYIRTVAKNKTLETLRRKAIEQRHKFSTIAGWVESDYSTQNTIILSETEKIVADAINILPPQQKKIYKLCYYDGIKQQEVANQLNISIQTVKVHLREASKSLKTYILSHTEVDFLLLLLFFHLF